MKEIRRANYEKLKAWLNPPKIIGVDWAVEGSERCYRSSANGKWEEIPIIREEDNGEG